MGGGVGVGCCMLGWSDEKDVHNYGNLGNSSFGGGGVGCWYVRMVRRTRCS